MRQLNQINFESKLESKGLCLKYITEYASDSYCVQYVVLLAHTPISALFYLDAGKAKLFLIIKSLGFYNKIHFVTLGALHLHGQTSLTIIFKVGMIASRKKI